MNALSLAVCHLVLAIHPWLPPFGIDRVGQGTEAVQADVRWEVSPRINPVDLGCVLPPHDWLLVGPEQKVVMRFAAFTKELSAKDAHLVTRFAAEPTAEVIAPVNLVAAKRTDVELQLPAIPKAGDVHQLQLSLQDGSGKELWSKVVNVSIVRKKADLPSFGATRLKLRYDAPISVREADGSFSSLDYQKAWNPELDDVVISLPSGGRFVFWRGSCYIPFWAGDCNTGLSYEWAETSPPKDGFADCVEPLMDKELRYGRVEIIENSAARVRVRWTYQSCDFLYKVWGDTAEEIFTFYPDGFGTRTLTIQSALDSDYELSEFIVLTPQGAYPLEILPKQLVAILFQDGSRHDIDFPVAKQLPEQFPSVDAKQFPALFRVRLHQDDPATAIYFSATDQALPPVAFGAFQDQGETVTRCYWGSHWPLSRGQTTGGKIDDRIHASPCHNSALSWNRHHPVPLREETLTAIDSLGRSKPMRRQTWTWLIGLSADSDQALLNRTKSFSTPPAITNLKGAQLDATSYSLEHRAIRLTCNPGAGAIEFSLSPQPVTVNPVFEIRGVKQSPTTVLLAGKPLDAKQWAFEDGVLWMDAAIEQPTAIQIQWAK